MVIVETEVNTCRNTFSAPIVKVTHYGFGGYFMIIGWPELMLVRITAPKLGERVW